MREREREREARHVELQSNYISRRTVGEIFFLNQRERERESSRPRGSKGPHQAPGYSIIRKEKRRKNRNLVISFRDSARYNETEAAIDEELYIFHAQRPMYSLSCLSLCLSPFLAARPFRPLFATNWKFYCLAIFPREGKEGTERGREREDPPGALVLQFKVANSLANLLLLL